MKPDFDEECCELVTATTALTREPSSAVALKDLHKYRMLEREAKVTVCETTRATHKPKMHVSNVTEAIVKSAKKRMFNFGVPDPTGQKVTVVLQFGSLVQDLLPSAMQPNT